MKRYTVTRAALEYSSAIVDAENEADAIEKARGGEAGWEFHEYEGDGWLEERIPNFTEYEVVDSWDVE